LLDFFTRYITNLCPKRRRYRKIVSGVSSVQQNSKRCAIGIVIHSRHQIHQLPSCKKSTLPWRPLLSYHSDAATHDRDMIGASYHRQATQLRCSDDLFDTIIVVSPQGYVEDSASADASSKSIATYVHRIINIRLLWRWHRTFYSIYM